MIVTVLVVGVLTGCSADANNETEATPESVEITETEVVETPEAETEETQNDEPEINQMAFVDMTLDDMSREEIHINMWVNDASVDAFITWRQETRNYCDKYGCEATGGGATVDGEGANIPYEAREMIAVATMRTVSGWEKTTWEELEPIATAVCERVEEWGGRNFLAMEMTRSDPTEGTAHDNAYVTTVSVGSLCPNAWSVRTGGN